MRRTPVSSPKGHKTSAPSKAPPAPPANTVAEAEHILTLLEDAKGHDVVCIPLAGQASFADYLIIATGTSTRHTAAMGRRLQEGLGKSILHTEGLNEGEWVCLDLGNIVVHLFIAEKRVLYNLEKLWSYVFTESPTETD